ncbi:hypothetical protein SADUNF_Sadunf06G0071700 [Salix dunnii]|uniref:Bifunctional inhibitor/plant lipid transfer protein/seed storage helical domain-containing protein n=1 Tax=Salix dunnii TaxID=1413687 RepID=A0A835K0Y3_9ROSI|nr:hypothetical protein SADUNF_Sadunf06G0071700 [Salix dunnii]
MKLAPCAAAQNEMAAVSDICCIQVKGTGQTWSCFCAAMLSDTAEASEIKSEIAITIPNRGNLANRPVDYESGGESACTYFLVVRIFFPPKVFAFQIFTRGSPCKVNIAGFAVYTLL